MRYILLLVIFQFLLFRSHAQKICNDEMVMNTKGKWEKRNDANVFPDSGFPKSQFAQANNRIDKMQKLLQAAYPEPKGIEAGWYRSISGRALIKGGPVPYDLNAILLVYYCSSNTKKMELGGETATWFYVYANHFNWFLEYDNNFTVKNNRVYLLTKKVGELHGYPVYQGIHNGTSNTGTKYSRTLIITRPGQSPYLPVTRKQYLTLFLKRAEKEKSNFLRTYVTDTQLKEQNLKKINKMYEDMMKPAQDLFNNISEEEARLPAIVEEGYVSKFERFLTEEQGGRMLVRLNPDYFDSKLPKYVPQFLVVYWRWEKDKASENFKNELEANFNFDALKAMIDK